MIHLFNRKELLITWNMKELTEIRDILASNHVDYTVKTVSTARTSSFSSGARGRTSTLGLRMDAMYQYHVYVKKSDFEKARLLIGR